MSTPKSERKTSTGYRNVYKNNVKGRYYVRVAKDKRLYHGERTYGLDELDAAVAEASRLRRSLGMKDVDRPFAHWQPADG